MPEPAIMRNKEERIYYHSWIADNEPGKVLNVSTDNLPSTSKPTLRFFENDLADPVRTNMHLSAQFGESIFRINDVTIYAYFTNQENVLEFIRSAMLKIYIGELDYLRMPGKICMEKAALTAQGTYKFDRPLVVPPRQLMYATLSVSDRLANTMIELQEGRLKEYGQIKVELHGYEYEPREFDIAPPPKIEYEPEEVIEDAWSPTSYLRKGSK